MSTKILSPSKSGRKMAIMVNKIIFFIAVGVLAFLVAFAFFTPANAQNPTDVQYPISELGNCGSRGECKAFCDAPENRSACLDWAMKNGLIPEREVKRMEDMKKFEEKAAEERPEGPVEELGPGGCKTPTECDAFCGRPENMEPCLRYSVKHGYTTPEEADRIRAQANKEGPGGCRSDRECRAFCDDPNNIEECMAFAVKEGEISKEEADFIIERTKERGGFGRPKGLMEEGGARGAMPEGASVSPTGPESGGRGPGPKINKEKAMKLLESKPGPGGCSTIKECAQYCDNPGNMKECADFAAKNNLLSEKEGEMVKKMLVFGGPGGCKTPSECDAFCGRPENMAECLNFARENGFIPPEEAEKISREMDIMRKLDHRGEAGVSAPSFGSEAPLPGDFQGRRGDFFGGEKFPPREEFSGDGQNVPKGFEPKNFNEGGRENGSSPDFKREGGNFPFRGENPRDFNGRDFERFMPRDGNYNRGDYKGEDFPEGAPENMTRNIPKNILEKMMKEELPPGSGTMPPEGVIPKDFLRPEEEAGFPPQGSFTPPPGGFSVPNPNFEGVPSEGFTEPVPPSPPGEFPEPTSMKSGSLIGAVLGPFLDIFTR